MSSPVTNPGMEDTFGGRLPEAAADINYQSNVETPPENKIIREQKLCFSVEATDVTCDIHLDGERANDFNDPIDNYGAYRNLLDTIKPQSNTVEESTTNPTPQSLQELVHDQRADGPMAFGSDASAEEENRLQDFHRHLQELQNKADIDLIEHYIEVLKAVIQNCQCMIERVRRTEAWCADPTLNNPGEPQAPISVFKKTSSEDLSRFGDTVPRIIHELLLKKYEKILEQLQDKHRTGADLIKGVPKVVQSEISIALEKMNERALRLENLMNEINLSGLRDGVPAESGSTCNNIRGETQPRFSYIQKKEVAGADLPPNDREFLLKYLDGLSQPVRPNIPAKYVNSLSQPARPNVPPEHREFILGYLNNLSQPKSQHVTNGFRQVSVSPPSGTAPNVSGGAQQGGTAIIQHQPMPRSRVGERRTLTESDRAFLFNLFGLYSNPGNNGDGPFDTRSPSDAAKASPFVVATEAILPDAPPSSIGHVIQYLSPAAPVTEDKGMWDPVQFLEMTNAVRNAFKSDEVEWNLDIELFDFMLDEVLTREPTGKAVEFSTIMYSRFDKLLESVIDMKKGGSPFVVELQDVVDKAILVHRSLQKRFHGGLTNIDQDRMRAMVRAGGLLESVQFGDHSKSGFPDWTAMKHSSIAREGPNLEVGKWWPHIACVHRDGVVNSTSGTEKYKRYEHTTLPLLRGVEVFDDNAGCLRYTLDGPFTEMQLHLQDKVGKSIRILRGYRLKSHDAPESGVRYDGMYMLKRYGHGFADPAGKLYRMRLWYERNTGQPDLNSAACVDTPSKQDDWNLYMRITKDRILKTCGVEYLDSWCANEEKEEIERKKWLSQQVLTTDRSS